MLRNQPGDSLQVNKPTFWRGGCFLQLQSWGERRTHHHSQVPGSRDVFIILPQPWLQYGGSLRLSSLCLPWNTAKLAFMYVCVYIYKISCHCTYFSEKGWLTRDTGWEEKAMEPWLVGWILKVNFFSGLWFKVLPYIYFTKSSALPDPVFLISHEGAHQSQAWLLVVTGDLVMGRVIVLMMFPHPVCLSMAYHQSLRALYWRLLLHEMFCTHGDVWFILPPLSSIKLPSQWGLLQWHWLNCVISAHWT